MLSIHLADALRDLDLGSYATMLEGKIGKVENFEGDGDEIAVLKGPFVLDY